MATKRPRGIGGTVVFDGACGFCVGAVRFVARRDRHGYFRFVPSHSPHAAALLSRYGLDRASVRSLVLVDFGRCYLRSDAVLRIAGRLAFPWWLAAGLLIVPRPLRDPLYLVVAALRHRMARRRAACEVLPPEVASRLL